MTKAELVNAVALKTGVSKAEIMTVIEASMESIIETMAEGENVYLRGFGTFALKTRKEKIARNIKKNTTILVPEHKIPTFKACKIFTNKLK